MKKNLFLTGLSGTGKSTLIHRALRAAGLFPVGFRTLRVYDGQGKVCAYVVSDIRSPERGVRFMNRVEGEKWHRDFLLFCRTAHEALDGAETFDVVLMDEIGGKELLDPTFYNRVVSLLESPVFCIGVLKDRAGVERQIKNHDPDNAAYRKAYEGLRSFLEESTNSVIYTVTEKNREEIFNRIVSLLKIAVISIESVSEEK